MEIAVCFQTENTKIDYYYYYFFYITLGTKIQPRQLSYEVEGHFILGSIWLDGNLDIPMSAE